MSRVGGVSYFTPEEREQLRREDRLMKYETSSERAERKRKNRTKYATVLRDARISRGLTQSELADRLGVDRRTVTRWETDCSTFPWDRVRAVLPEIGPMPEDYPGK